MLSWLLRLAASDDEGAAGALAGLAVLDDRHAEEVGQGRLGQGTGFGVGRDYRPERAAIPPNREAGLTLLDLGQPAEVGQHVDGGLEPRSEVAGRASDAGDQPPPDLAQQPLAVGAGHPVSEGAEEVAEHGRVRLGEEALAVCRQLVQLGRLAPAATDARLLN